MSQFSNYTEAKILGVTLRGSNWTANGQVYVALFTADPTDAATAANEVQTSAWGAYARQDAAAGASVETGWSDPGASSGISSNAKVITYPANNGAGPVTVTHVALYDALTNGNMLYYAPLVSSKTLQVGDVLSFAIGSLTVTVA